jgi:cytochrome c553
MSVRIFSVAGLLAILVLASSPLRAAGDAAAGAEKNAMCQGCHGIKGFRIAYPTVYIVAALKAYKAGDRNFPTMQAIASGLSDQDMEDLAAYYSSGGK